MNMLTDRGARLLFIFFLLYFLWLWCLTCQVPTRPSAVPARKPTPADTCQPPKCYPDKKPPDGPPHDKP